MLFIKKKLKGGFPELEMYNIGDLKLRTEFFKAGTAGKSNEDANKVNITSNVTYGDIDNNQAMGFQTDKLKATYTYPTTKLKYVQDKGKGAGTTATN